MGLSTMRIKSFWQTCIAVALPAIVLTGCNESNTTDTTLPAQDNTGTASLTISATFPPAANLGTALIDENTQAFTVEVCDQLELNCQTGEISRDNPSTSINGLSPGNGFIVIRASDDSGTAFDRIVTGVSLTEGINTFTAYMIRGEWTLNNQIVLSKTLSTATDTLTAFTITSPLKLEADIPAGSNTTRYQGNWTGTGLYDTALATNTATAVSSRLTYGTKFTGPSSASNFVDDLSIALKPDPAYPAGVFNGSNRHAFIAGSASGKTFVDTSTLSAYNSRVSNGTTITGTIVEALFTSATKTIKCYAGTNTTASEITCPSDVSVAKAGVTPAMTSALASTLPSSTSQAGKAAIGSDNCYAVQAVDLKSAYNDFYTPTGTTDIKPMYVVEQLVGNAKLCIHPFTATGTQLQTTSGTIGVARR